MTQEIKNSSGEIVAFVTDGKLEIGNAEETAKALFDTCNKMVALLENRDQQIIKLKQLIKEVL